MSMQHDEELRELFRKGVDPLVSFTGFEPRLRSRLREHARRRPHRAPQVVFSAVVSLALVAALVAGFLVTRGSGTRTPTSQSVIQALTQGAPASGVADPTSSFVWLTAYGAEGAPATSTSGPACLGETAGSQPTPSGVTCSGNLGPFTMTISVDVIDWTGTVRHRFSLPEIGVGSYPQRQPDSIFAISPDGTRALLLDGRVIDDTGRVVADLTSLGSLLTAADGSVGVQWLSDDTGICVAGPSPLINDPAAWSSLVNGDTPESYTTLLVEEVAIDGQTRTVATLDVGQTLDSPLNTNSVDACDPATDTAVIAHFAGGAGLNTLRSGEVPAAR